ncbi:LysR family transcriptional regulator [Chondromyces crocatus]|uniref:Transcriptional regulator n=1 Tax=Chondromyces crocatus TaxID=52 RepID=A0A0K1EMW5_CHOCO|nr:LysR family transcriptional regulator [Chondromyces crocatus]AKT42240.1 transcriptional regulator [Chondromyces crocatus]
MRLDLRHLHLLVAIDDLGSLHAAARRLHLSASALSLQLRDLEDRLGGQLFERRWRRLHVTPAGRRLTHTARAVLADLARAEAETRLLLAGHTGTLRITTACMQTYHWLPPVLESWSRAHPDTQVSIVGEAGVAPLDALRDGAIDLALVVGDAGDAPSDDRVQFTPLFRDELVALVSPRHPLARRRQVRARDLAAEAYWGAPDSFAPGTPLGDTLAADGVSFTRVTPLAYASGAPLEMVRANLGVTVCPRWFAEPDLARREVVALRIGGGLWLDWSAATARAGGSPHTASFIAEMKRHRPTPSAAG